MTAWIVTGICIVGAALTLLAGKFTPKIEMLAAAATVSAFIAVCMSRSATPLLFPPETLPISVAALGTKNDMSHGTEVYISRITVDGREYRPQDILSGGWAEDSDGQGYYGWRDYSPGGMPKEIHGSVPKGASIEITFQAAVWRGIAEARVGESEAQTIDCFAATDDVASSTKTLFFAFPSLAEGAATERPRRAITAATCFAAALAAILMVALLHGRRRGARARAAAHAPFPAPALASGLEPAPTSASDPESASARPSALAPAAPRDIWADALRIAAAFAVVLLHSCIAPYNIVGDDVRRWHSALLLRSFTSFAVPCFFMLSGAFLLRHKQSVASVMGKRLPKLAIPLAAWSAVYAIAQRGLSSSLPATGNAKELLAALAGALYSATAPHLWFMYSMIGIYIMLPLLSGWYAGAGLREKIWTVVAAYAAPSLLTGARVLMAGAAVPPAWEMLSTDVALFIMGAMLYEHRAKLCAKRSFPLAVTAVGYCLVVAPSYYMYVKTGLPSDQFFDWSSPTSTVFFAGVFMLFMSLESLLREKLTEKARLKIGRAASLSMGVYLAHPIFLDNAPIFAIVGVRFGTGADSLAGTLAAAAIYFAASMSLCRCLSILPLLREAI
jgi:surface polysaccharide O-acyltransferase-like enzyme